MRAAHELPVAYEEPESRQREPIITLIGSDLPPAYLDDAEPSPMMERATRFWRNLVRTIKWLVVAGLVGGYPLAMVLSHKVDDRPVILSNLTPWASPEAGTALTLIGRELTGAGWAEDRPFWHPQARLTALPAWQDGLISAMSDYAMLMSGLATDAEGNADRDLAAAGRLLTPTIETEVTPRLNAAAEALQRYDGRLSRGLASAPTGRDSFAARLGLFTTWAADGQERLRASARTAEAWPAAREDIEAIYSARAHAHVAAQLLAAAVSENPDLVASRPVAEARDRAMAAWDRAARFNPIFVTSQAGTSRFLSDHPATMAFYMLEAEEATRDLQMKVLGQGEAPIAVAETVASPQ